MDYVKKLLYVINDLKIADAISHFSKDGFEMLSKSDDYWIFSNKNETYSLRELHDSFDYCSTKFKDESAYLSSLDSAIKNYGFTFIEDNDVKVLVKNNLTLLFSSARELLIFSITLSKRPGDYTNIEYIELVPLN